MRGSRSGLGDFAKTDVATATDRLRCILALDNLEVKNVQWVFRGALANDWAPRRGYAPTAARS